METILAAINKPQVPLLLTSASEILLPVHMHCADIHICAHTYISLGRDLGSKDFEKHGINTYISALRTYGVHIPITPRRTDTLVRGFFFSFFSFFSFSVLRMYGSNNPQKKKKRGKAKSGEREICKGKKQRQNRLVILFLL